MAQPHLLNLYAYANNNPLRYTDPTGMDSNSYADASNPFKPIYEPDGSLDISVLVNVYGIDPVTASKFISAMPMSQINEILVKYQHNMAQWAAYYCEKSVNVYYQREADKAQAHFNFAIEALSTHANTEWGLSVDSADIMSWVDYGANTPYMKGGNLNIALVESSDYKNDQLQRLRNGINQDSRSSGMYSLHLHKAQYNNPAYFHVDTFSGKISTPGNLIMHLLWDGFVGTVFYNSTGLHGR